ncbi:hypothetical protein [Myxococcus phage Mx1]|nr:hypothetical protein [Myxococcus phage Mx1]
MPDMSKTEFLLAEFEINGYHDSDFMGIVYNAETDAIVFDLLGSTAFAGMRDPKIYGSPTYETVEAARKVLARTLAKMLIQAEHDDVFNPKDVLPETKVRLKAKHRNMVKVKEPHQRCNGTGKWVNPRNLQDVRACLGCDGTGEFVTKERVKAEDGKQAYETFEAGTVGTVVDSRKFSYHGEFSLKVKAEDGRTFQVPASKVRLDREPKTDAELTVRADELSRHLNFGRLHPRFAWLSKDYATEVWKAGPK